MIDAGRLNQRIELQQKQVTRNAIGEEVVTWPTLATLWAEVTPLRGREFFAAAQLQASVELRVTIRYRADVTTDLRLLWRGVAYDISAVIPVAGSTEALELMCASGVHDGR